MTDVPANRAIPRLRLLRLMGLGFPPYYQVLALAYMAGGENAELLPSAVMEDENEDGENLFFRYSSDLDGNMIVYIFWGESSDLSAVQAIKDGQTLWEEFYVDNIRTQYNEFDDAGNLTAAYLDLYGTGEENMMYMLRTYDTHGNLLKVEGKGFDVEEEYSYDEKGNLLQKKIRTSENQVSTYQYEPEFDSAGRLIHSVGRSEGRIEEEYFYTYDDDGNLIEREYDDYSDPEYRKRTVWDGDGRVLSATGDDGFTYTFSYNVDGDCILANWQEGSSIATSKIDYLNGHPLCSYVEFVTTDDSEWYHDQPELYLYDNDGRLAFYESFRYEEPLTYRIWYEKAETLQQNEDPRPNT